MAKPLLAAAEAAALAMESQLDDGADHCVWCAGNDVRRDPAGRIIVVPHHAECPYGDLVEAIAHHRRLREELKARHVSQSAVLAQV